jgi:hypothetical protein
MGMLLSCVIGVIIGTLISYFVRRHYTIGNLRIDNSDIDDSPYMFLEMDSSNGGVRWISKQKYIVLNVLVKDYISHE